MKVAYLIDKESIGGGCEYIRRKIAELPEGDSGRMFCSAKGECRPATLRAWGAEKVVFVHLRAAVQLFGLGLLAGRRPAGMKALPMVFTVHGIHLRKFDWMPRNPLNLVKRRLRRTLESRVYKLCDEIVALTGTDAADIHRLYGANLKVRVEPNTISGWIPPSEEDFAAARDVLSARGWSEFDFVCIGRFNFQKGQDRWIHAISGEGNAFGERSSTLFVGGGETLESCRRLAARLGVADRCCFLGEMPDAERFLGSAAAVVSPSRWEGMPYLMMKARALGCRILATDCPGNRDVLEGYDRWTTLFGDGEFR